MTSSTTAVPTATQPAAVPPRPALLPRLVAAAVVPLYVAGATAAVVLTRRLGGPTGNPLEGVALYGAFAGFAVLGALLVARVRATRSAG